MGYPVHVLLAPEHGLEAAAGAGEPIPHLPGGELPVLSMYGADRGPVEEALAQVDRLVVDLPDVGCRYYTYAWTVREALKLAARHAVSVTILDRPNPIGGVAVEGNRPESIESPVCASPTPVRHGLTLGELARWQVRSLGIEVDLSVITAKGWHRRMLWPETGLDWVPPSPALRSFEATLAYPGTTLLEGTNISEGRGTDRSFLLLGAPFVDGEALARQLSDHPYLHGAAVNPARFTPASSKWSSEACGGVSLEIRDVERFFPVRAGLAIVGALRARDGFEFRASHFDALAGGSTWRRMLDGGRPVNEIVDAWSAYEREFDGERREVELYE
jgi:uncharacterized protein YbbC (DUF1343 family)